jgi:hypothetical protein
MPLLAPVIRMTLEALMVMSFTGLRRRRHGAAHALPRPYPFQCTSCLFLLAILDELAEPPGFMDHSCH